MKVLQLSREVESGELKMRARVPYVMADPIADSLAQEFAINVQRKESFEQYYTPYMGQKLDNKRIAIWRTGGYGDLLLITPIVEWLKRKYPTCRISVATSERFRDVWQNNPNIDSLTSAFSLPLPLSFITKHDYVGIFEGTIENFKSKSQFCAIDAFAFNLGIFDMPAALKRPRYYLTSADINATRNKVQNMSGLNIATTPYIVFQWKSSSILRDYPYEKLIHAMVLLQELTGYKIVILTHPMYKFMIDAEIQIYMDHVCPGKTLDYANLSGVTNYRGSAAVLALSSGLVGIDSSLTHLAAALGVPSVSLYGPFKAEWRTAYNRNNISIQHQEVCPSAPCAYHTQPNEQDGLPYKLCTVGGTLPQYSRDKFCRAMSSITTKEIVEAFMRLLEMQKEGTLPEERMFKCQL